MGKLIFAGMVLAVGLALYGALRRRGDFLHPSARPIALRAILVLAIGVPTMILAFSIFRIIPAGHVGVKVLFGQVDPVPLREGLNVVWNPLYDIEVMDTRVQKHTAK